MDSKKPTLTDREKLILQAVVHSYITTAEPVGSRTIVKRFDLDLSPATVRNTMADLEDAGFLQQLHTSSGRVPTDTGYRYYVDYLMHVQQLTIGERERIATELNQRLTDADEILKQTSHLLALASHHTGIAEAPADCDAKARQVDIVLVNDNRVAVLIADNYGRVRTIMVTLEEPLSRDEIPKLNAFLNEHLRDVEVDHLATAVRQRLAGYVNEQHRLAETALRVLNLVHLPQRGQLFLDGTMQLFEEPEFRDVAKAREVFGLLEEQDRVIGLLRAAQRDAEGRRNCIVIGSETQSNGLEDISLVASPYYVGDRPAGVLGIIGPRRMHYSKLAALVDYTSGMVSRLLTRLAG